MTADGKRSAERLTGRERVLRGAKYGLAIFAVEFVPVLVSWLVTAGPHERQFPGAVMGWGRLCFFLSALIAGFVFMGFRQRRLWHRVAAGAVAVATIVFWGLAESRMEVYCPWNPAIDTVFTEGYSEKAFCSIRPGMTEAEVLALLGEPFDKLDWYAAARNWTEYLPCVCWRYSGDGKCRWGDFAWLLRMVLIRDGVVLGVHMEVFPD